MSKKKNYFQKKKIKMKKKILLKKKIKKKLITFQKTLFQVYLMKQIHPKKVKMIKKIKKKLNHYLEIYLKETNNPYLIIKIKKKKQNCYLIYQ